jgi:hypothetical protein
VLCGNTLWSIRIVFIVRTVPSMDLDFLAIYGSGFGVLCGCRSPGATRVLRRYF